MLVKSRAVVLHRLRFNDKDSVVCLFSRDFGRVSYLVANKKRKGALSPALFQPLSLIDYQADHKGSRQLQRLQEAHCLFPAHGMAASAEKNAVSIFLSEVLYRVLVDLDASPALYDFIETSVRWLDLTESSCANFHLMFLLHLSRHLGCYPNIDGYVEGSVFDLTSGCFSPQRPLHRDWLPASWSKRLKELMETDFAHMDSLSMSREQRNGMLDGLLRYFRLHLGDFPEIKSLEILQELFEVVVPPGIEPGSTV